MSEWAQIALIAAASIACLYWIEERWARGGRRRP